MKIIKFNEIDNNEKYIPLIRDIFFEASVKKDFSSDKEKDDFFYRWCGIYLEHYRDSFYLAIDDDSLVGYLSGCKDSMAACEILDLPGYLDFKEEFKEFQAHFHINCHHEHRGKGIGKSLVEKFCLDLVDEGIRSVFIITGAMTKPTSFYLKMGFNHSYTKWLSDKFALILMGKLL